MRRIETSQWTTAATAAQVEQARSGAAAPTPGRSDKAADAARKLDQLLFQGMVDAMVPKTMMGGKSDGAAGDAWRSMLVDTLAQHLARAMSQPLVQLRREIAEKLDTAPTT